MRKGTIGFKVLRGTTSLKLRIFRFFFLHFSTASQVHFEEEEGKLYGPGIVD